MTEPGAMPQRLREPCRRLLEEGKVQVVIGWGGAGRLASPTQAESPAPLSFPTQAEPPAPLSGAAGGAGRLACPTQAEPHAPLSGTPAPRPVFITRAEDAEKLEWNDRCFANLTVYLTRKEVKALGKAAVVVKGCDERSLVVLEKESQIERGSLHAIGMVCEGVGTPREAKCAGCEVRVPRFADETIGEAEGAAASATAVASRLDGLMAKSPAERWAFWTAEFARCVKCYACRQVCPLCYCERCIADKNRPVAIETSASARGNFAWHITRAFHLAARCIGCGECSRACPAGIPLGLLNQSLAQATEEDFGYRPGMDPKAEPVFGNWSPADKEDFIR